MSESAEPPAFRAIVAEARSHVADGRAPDVDALEARLRAAAKRARESGAAERAHEVTAAERRALRQLRRVVAVHRARTLVAREPRPPVPAPAPASAPARRPGGLRTRPMVNANMDVRRDGESTLAWDRAAGVTGWEMRLSERPDPRRDYVVRETSTLPPETTRFEVPLGELPVRVHVLGRGRGGKLVRRAIVSGLTEANWGDRWERRASAA